MLGRYTMHRGKRPDVIGIRQDTRKHTRHCLRPNPEMVTRLLDTRSHVFVGMLSRRLPKADHHAVSRRHVDLLTYWPSLLATKVYFWVARAQPRRIPTFTIVTLCWHFNSCTNSIQTSRSCSLKGKCNSICVSGMGIQTTQNILPPALEYVHHKGRYDAPTDRKGTLFQPLFVHPNVG